MTMKPKVITSIKNTSLQFLSIDEKILKYSGHDSVEHLIGKTDFEMPWSEYAPAYKKHDLDALTGKTYTAFMLLKDYQGKKHLFAYTKQAIVSSESKQIIGLMCHIHKVKGFGLQKFINKKTTPSWPATLNNAPNNLKLSAREHLCLFYLLRGHTAKMIAAFLEISPRTVESHICRLRTKFGVKSKMQLIDKAIDLGYYQLIPGKAFSPA